MASVYVCFLRPVPPQFLQEPAVSGQSLLLLEVPLGFTALAWSWSGAWAGRTASLPALRPWPLYLTVSPRLSGPRASGWWPSQHRTLPLGSPAAHIRRFMAPGQSLGACRLDVLRFLLASPSRQGLWGPFRASRAALRSRPSRRAGEQQFPGESGFLAGLTSHFLCVWLGSARPAHFDPHLVLGLCGCGGVRWCRVTASPHPGDKRR